MDSSPLPREINIVTLNCWGLKFNISKLRKERLEEIGRQLSQTQPPPHVVCLQEVWSHHDYLAIRRSLRRRLPHGKFYHSGAFGAGLVILSRWPIESATMTPYTLNGRPTAFWRGDWFVGKGVAHAALRLSPTDPLAVIDVFTTHTHAPYASDTEDSYAIHRAAQAWALAKLLRAAAAQPGHLVVAAGDFNMAPCGLEHRLLTAHAPVRDVWRVLHPAPAPAPGRALVPPSAARNLAEHGVTADSVLNTWRWPAAARARLGPGKPLNEPAPDTPDPRGQRLDYIFVTTAPREIFPDAPRGGASGGRRDANDNYADNDNDDGDDDDNDDDDDGGIVVGGYVVRDARVGMVQRHPELGCSLSDHFSVEATLAFHTITLPTQRGRDGGRDRDADAAAADVASTTAPSLTGWPLPPSCLSFARRRSTIPHPHSPHKLATTTTTTAAAAADPARPTVADRAANGAFLSLQSPTPSTSHRGSPPPPRRRPHSSSSSSSRHQPADDPDTQLLAALYRPPPPYAHPDDPGLGLGHDQQRPFTPADYTALLAALARYQAREADQVRLRAAHAGFWLFVLFACGCAVWIVPAGGDGGGGGGDGGGARLSEAQNHAVNFVLVLLSSVGLVAGAIDGLMALLFFAGSERRALKEFEWELRNAKRIALGEDETPLEQMEVEKYS